MMHTPQRRREWSQRQCSCKRSSISGKQQRIMSLYIILGFKIFATQAAKFVFIKYCLKAHWFIIMLSKNIRNTKEKGKEKQVTKEVEIHMLFNKSMLNLFFFYSCLHILVCVCVEANFCLSDIKLTIFVMAIYGIENFFFCLPILVFK